MEIFPYEDWLAEGRRKARAKGTPDTSTEAITLETYRRKVVVIYTVELKTTTVQFEVAEYDTEKFSTLFEAMLGKG